MRRFAKSVLILLVLLPCLVGPGAERASASGRNWVPQTLRIEGAFEPTLYATLARAIPDSILNRREREYMAWELADVFRWETDFTHDLQLGGTYRIVFERLLLPFGEVRYGRLLAAEIRLGNKTFVAYEFDDSQGRTAYYDEDGVSMRRAFLRVPLQFRRVSSPFSAGRYHPVLGLMRRHEGIDYAAASGTPVMAAGDGVVRRIGRAGGYGNMIEIRHENGMVTRYAHLRAYAPGIRKGSHVTQGQRIGLVGQTGLATGPHLHFEIRVNGVAKNPRLVDTGAGEPVAAVDREAFFDQVERLRTVLVPAGRALAAAGDGNSLPAARPDGNGGVFSGR